MKIKSRFIWFAAISLASILIVMAIMLLLFWQSLDSLQRQVFTALFKANFSYIFSVGVLLLAAMGFVLDWFFRFYIIPVSRLTEEVELMLSVNPDFRTRIHGSKEVTRLGKLINEGADRYASLKNTVNEKVQHAQAEAQIEKRILATIMDELPAGVIICNDQGQILLYNRRAKHYLGSRPGLADEKEPGHEPSQAFLGLGRSIFGVIDKRLVVHALDEIAVKLERKAADTAAYFVIVGQHKELLRAEAVPILDKEQLVTGLIIRLTDITADVSTEDRRFRQRQKLIHQLRGRLAAIRCSAELLDTYTEMAPVRQSDLITVIAKESAKLSDLVQWTIDEDGHNWETRWPLVPMMATDLMLAIRRKSAEQLKLEIQTGTCECQAKVMVDTYSFVLAVLFVLQHLKSHSDEAALEAVIQESGRLVNLDFYYTGAPIDSATLNSWQNCALVFMEESLPLTLWQVWNHHSAKLWSAMRQEMPGTAYLRLCLPVSEDLGEEPHVRRMTLLPEERPEFYDFDLFHQPGQNPRQDNRMLSELGYTVFDTETTGLDPNGGDEIISIGAVRVLNGRLLRNEFFDQLINPQRPLPYASVKIHGIQEEMLADQPTIDAVLRVFHRFCEETVLVAHNAAFDMRMLQLKESKSGVHFINPVLDTMHLSAVVHPAHEDHGITAIANRLGISVVGRHTALGDAITTGEIFLKLIPLLAEKGIYTLAEARRASQKTYYARLKY
jgi:DNA polymerase III subunit epsilon